MKCERCGEVNPAEIHTCTPKPVAYMHIPHDDRLEIVFTPHKFNHKIYKSIVPVYTIPPQREWQGLTDDEIIDAANMAPFETMVSAEDYIYIIARAIEAKLKEKNHG